MKVYGNKKVIKIILLKDFLFSPRIKHCKKIWAGEFIFQLAFHISHEYSLFPTGSQLKIGKHQQHLTAKHNKKTKSIKKKKENLNYFCFIVLLFFI